MRACECLPRGLLLTLGVGGILATAASCRRAASSTLPTIPDTPAGRVFRVWLDAYNASDSASIEAYSRQYEPAMSVHAQLVTRMQTGPWDVASVERSEPRYLAVVLRTGDGPIARYSPITMYAVIQVAGDTRLRATTSLALLGRQVRAPLRIGKRERVVAIDSLVAKLIRNYVSLDVANRIADSLRARQSRGVYDDYPTEVGFAMRLNNDLVALGGDRQLAVEYAWRVPLPPPSPTPAAMLHCGFDPVKLLADSVGYVRFYGLGNPDWDCGHEVSNVMRAVAGSRALILDLRETTDDSRTRMAYLASYLVDGCTHLGDIWDRATAQTEMLWTRDGLPGPAFGGTKPLYILTSPHTFAAAEELAYDLQSLGRATVVGEPTAGAAYTIAVGQIGEHLLASIPIARAVNPITGSNWQRVGVAPDVPVAASEALDMAQQLIREKRSVHARIAAARGAPERMARSVAAPALIPSITSRQLGGAPSSLRGIRFAIDTLVPFVAQRDMLSRVAGIMMFAGGRGRLDVTAVSHAPAVALDGFAITEPLARRGDYYLFDNLGFVLVRPASRTFSSFTFTRADFNFTGALLPGAYMMRRSTIDRVDTLPASDLAARRQYEPISVHWHMQPRNNAPPNLEHAGGWGLYARGWLEVEDAPGIEAGVARWFEVAAALATRPGGVSDIGPDGLEVTSVVRFNRRMLPSSPVQYLETLAPSQLAAVDIDQARLAIPLEYTETPWGTSGPGPGTRASPRGASARWYAPEDTLSQRGRAACRQAWLPEAHAGPSADARASFQSLKP